MILFLSWIFFVFAQEEESHIYLTDIHWVDVFVHHRSKNQILQGWIYKDSVYKESKNLNGLVPYLSTYIDKPENTPHQKPDFSLHKGLKQYFEHNILVGEKEYTIQISHIDDGFIGGRPNQVNVKIVVEEIGVIYSYDNFFDAHQLYLLFASNSEQQEVISKVYQSLDEKNIPFGSWKNISKIIELYNYVSFIPETTKKWKQFAQDIQLVQTTSERSGDTIRYQVHIQNTSQQDYCFMKGAKVSPAWATIHTQDKQDHWDLRETHYGKHFSNLPNGLLIPKQKTTYLTLTLPVRTGCGACTHLDYFGFQQYVSIRPLHWFIQSSSYQSKEKCVPYPLREIQKKHE